MATDRQFLTIDGYRLAYLAQGDPAHPPLLMVHGWLSQAGVWRSTMNALADSHYCVAVDLLGHAQSDKPPDADYTVPAQAARILKVADALNLSTFTLVGHSMGGMIGVYLALHAPERLTQLVAISPVVNGRLSDYARIVLTPIFWLGSFFPPVWSISRAVAKHNQGGSIVDRAIFYQPVNLPYEDENRQMGMVPGIEIPAYRDLQAIAALDLTNELPKIKTPTLVIFGARDNCVPVVNGQLLERNVPGCQLVMLEACGHTPMLEQPDACVQALKGFLLR